MSQHNESLKAEVLLRYANSLSRHSMRRAHKEILKLCRDVESIVMTNLKTKYKMIVATYDHSVVTKEEKND